MSKKLSQKLPFNIRGLAVRSTFHPSLSIFFICTKRTVRVYDLVKGKLLKKLETGLKEASSVAVHPGGIVFSYDEIKLLSVFFYT